jgi:hypothetical protein
MLEAVKVEFERVIKAYPFDALSHYLYPSSLPSFDHLRIYQRGHCLDLAVALSSAVGGQIVGQRKPGAPIGFYHHYALHLNTPQGAYWLDPSLEICTPLKPGAIFYLGEKQNRIDQVRFRRFELTIDGARQITIAYEPVVDLARAQVQIRRTRKDLTLRYGGEQIRYLWRQRRFQWGERLLLPTEFTAAQRDYLSAHFRCDVGELLEAFLSNYLRIPDTFWYWEI